MGFVRFQTSPPAHPCCCCCRTRMMMMMMMLPPPCGSVRGWCHASSRPTWGPSLSDRQTWPGSLRSNPIGRIAPLSRAARPLPRLVPVCGNRSKAGRARGGNARSWRGPCYAFKESNPARSSRTTGARRRILIFFPPLLCGIIRRRRGARSSEVETSLFEHDRANVSLRQWPGALRRGRGCLSGSSSLTLD